MITDIFSPPPTTWISPGSTVRFPIALPACSVVSDPCDEHIALKLSLHTKEGHDLELETPERSYTIVADPHATFAENGDRGNHPIVIARGEIESSIPQTTIVLVFFFPHEAGATPPAISEQDRVDAIFSARNVGGGSAALVAPGGTQVRRFLTARTIDASVSAAIADVKAAFGDRVIIAAPRYTPFYGDVLSAQSRAITAARLAVSRPAAFIGSEESEPSPLSSASQVAVERSADTRGFIPMSSFINQEIESAADGVSSSEAGDSIDVRIQTTAAFATRSEATFPVCCSRDFRAADYIGRDDEHVLALPLQVTIAADRPEIFVAAESSNRVAEKLGLDASSVSIARAAELASDLAADLGASPGPLTLVATYPDVELSDGSTVVPAGVAVAPLGDIDVGWRSFGRAPTPTPTRVDRVLPVPVAMAMPSAPPTLPPFLGENPLATFAVPIVVSVAGTLHRWHADVPVRASGGVDCATLVIRAQRASLAKAVIEAVAKTRQTRTVLRHIVLVTAYPATVEGDVPCTLPTAQMPVVVHAPVDVTFRTRPPTP